MRFDRIELSNFKCYGGVDVSLEPGVTVIHGPNGSGKSSLLEACFFALYGTTAFDRNLEDVVTTGEEEAEVDLRFVHAGGEYRLHRRVRATGDRASTADCVLEAPDGTIEGVTDVEARVADLLRMDAEAFVNCAYVRQGEINKLINATPSDRQDMIDELLQLGKLEDYRDRASEARLAVRRLRERWEDRLEDRDEQIGALEDRDLYERESELRTELDEVDAEIERYEENREEARETLAEAESAIERYEERREELAEVEERIDDLTDRIAETEREREGLADEIREHRERIDDLDDRIADLLAGTELDGPDPDAVEERRSELADRREAVVEDREAVIGAIQEAKAEAERHGERVDDLESRARERRSEADDHEADLEDLAEGITDLRGRIDDLEGRIEDKRAAFEGAPVEFGAAVDRRDDLRERLEAAGEREAGLREELAPVRSRIEEAEELLAEGKCPRCGQPVEGSPHVDELDDLRERERELASEIEAVEEERAELRERVEEAERLAGIEDEVADLESTLELARERLGDREEEREQARERVEELREEAAELEEEAGAAREAAAAARERREEKQAELGDLNRREKELDGRIDRLDDLAETAEERADHEAEVERLRERRELLDERNDERRETLTERRERRRELRDAVDEERIEEARARKRRAEEYLDEVGEALDELGERRDALIGELDTTRSEIERLEELREERDRIEGRVEDLRGLHDETERLQGAYADLRADLRRRNVARLERLLNETFDLVYRNESYARIELDESYELTVYQKDGEPLEPEQLSGGERALFNLSLRAAIYRLLAEGIEGAAPMPPLILDEPTVFLDSGHVSQLVELVGAMRELGVEQIIVVSHDEELVGAADDLLTVDKDGTSNRSTVERAGQLSPAD